MTNISKRKEERKKGRKLVRGLEEIMVNIRQLKMKPEEGLDQLFFQYQANDKAKKRILQNFVSRQLSNALSARAADRVPAKCRTVGKVG